MKLLATDAKPPYLNAKSREGMAAIHYASANDHSECVKSLFKAGADVNMPGAGGKTALIEAAASGHFDTVKYLVQDAKANVNSKDK